MSVLTRPDPAAFTAPAATRQAPLIARRWSGVALDAGAVALFLLLPWLYFWRLFTPYAPDQMTLAEGDFNVEFFPVTRAIGAIIRGGELPLWNPWSDGGQPLLADPQMAIWYPLNWVLPWLVTDNERGSLVAYEAFMAFHFFLTAVAMWLLARRVIGSRFGALVAALTFAYSGLLTAYPIQQMPILRTSIWLPILLLCLINAFEQRSLRWTVVGALALALAVFAGHPQLLLFQLYGLTLYTLYRCAQVWPDRRAVATTLGQYALFGVLGFAIAAIQVVPSYEFMRLSDRAAADYAFTAVGFSPFEFLLDAAAPRIIGGLPPYVGILPLLLAVIAIRFVRQRHLPYFVLLAALGLVISFGGNTFFHSLLYLGAPGFALFQHQERAIYLYTLAMAVLAGYGAAFVARPLSRRQRTILVRLGWAGLAGVVAALVVAGTLYAGYLLVEATGRAYRWRDVIGWYNWFVFMLCLGLALLALRLLWRRGRLLLLSAIPAAILLDLFTVSWSHDLSPLPPAQLFVPSQIVQFIQSQRSLLRVADYTVLNGNHGLVYLVPSVDGTYGMFLERFVQLRAALPPERFYELLNVRYVLTRQAPPDEAQVVLAEPFHEHLNRVVRVDGVLERATVVPRGRVVDDDAQALAMLGDPEFDPRQEVLLAEPPGPAVDGGSGRARIRAYRANSLELEVSASGGYLLLSEMHYPGWRAEVNGVERPLVRANYALRALALQPGDRDVRIVYDPPSLKLGALITALALLVAAALLILPRVLPKRGAGAHRQAPQVS